MTTPPHHRRPALLRLASLAMLGTGALVLMADSADCPDGYGGGGFDATFTTTCRAEFAPPRGELHLRVEETKDEREHESAAARALAAAGIQSDGAWLLGHSGAEVCVPSSLTIGQGALRCAPIDFGKTTQTVTCSRSQKAPVVLQLGRRDLSDASISDAATDAEDSSTDAAASPDAAARPDASITPGSPASPLQEPAPDCTFTFVRTP